MTYSWRRYGLVLAVLCAALIGCGVYGPRHLSGAIADTSLASVEDQVAQDLRDGHFDQGATLLTTEARTHTDLQQLASWTTAFKTEQDTFASQRQDQFEKNIKDVHTLIDHGFKTYALDAVDQAYIRAPDKDAFRHEKWIDDLVQNGAVEAQSAVDQQNWLTALRIYTDLTGVDPYEPKWKDKLKQVTRSLQLVMLYSPDFFKPVQKAELARRKEVDALLHPTTQPDTQPVVADDDAGDFKLDWHDTVRGVSLDMVLDSIVQAEHDYYRDVNIKTLLNGGINMLRTMVATKGLEQAFPNLADETKKKDFLWALDQASAQANLITPDNEATTVHDCMTSLIQANMNTVHIPEEVLLCEFANGALGELDPFTSVIWPYDVPEFLQTTRGAFSGIGIQIESAEDGNLKVVTPVSAEAPAYRAGIRAGDVITRIDGKNAHGITTNQAVKNITGPPHTFVVLTMRTHDGNAKIVTVERDVINVDSVKGYDRLPGGAWNYFVDPVNKIAYLRLTNFTAESDGDITRAMQAISAQGAKGLILDLRYNPGGLLDAAVKIASKFVREGVIVSTHPDRPTENQPTSQDAEPDKSTTDMPLAVLVNQYSASASEIVSGALKDHHRATIVGERSFGKGSVQMLHPLAANTALLKLTTSHYYLPSGRCLHREENSTVWGVDPDVAIPMTPEQMRAEIDSRTELETLRDSPSATTQPDGLATDAQLSGALLVMRLKLAGVHI